MLNMCIPIPSSLLPETLISGSCNDSPLFTSPSDQASPVAAPDRSSLAMEDSTSENEAAKSDLQLGMKEEPDGGGDKVQAEHESNDGGEQEPGGGGEKVPEEQMSDGGGEKVLEEQVGEKFVEEQESDGGGEKVLEERGHETADEAKEVLGEVGEAGGCSNEVLVDNDEASRARNFRKYPKPVANRSHFDPFRSRFGSDSNGLGFNSSSDFNDDYSDTGLHMHAPFLLPPPPPHPVGAGLANMGNTCFLNAVMQCFTHTVPLVHGLHSLFGDGVPSHHNDGEFCVLSAVGEHVFHALAASGEVLWPDNLVNNLSYISSFFQKFQQEDAHEYLQCLLDKIDTCWSKCKVDCKAVSSEGDSLVKQVFGGRLVSQLHCCKCGSRSDTYEPLVDLSLEIEDADDLNGALKSFTKMEENEDEVKFTCEKCKEQVPLKKQLLIEQAPSVATLHLKRFKGDGYFVEKIDKNLEYPLELDLKPYTVHTQDENVDLKYELYAFIVHKGYSSTSGHYLCYIRSSPDKWFRIDDSKVTAVREEVALLQQGYILFYARKGTPWPCSLVKASGDNGTWHTSPKSVLDNLEHTHYSNLRRACLYNENVVESSAVREASTQLPVQQALDEACGIGPSRNVDEVASSELSTIPKKEVCNGELIDGKSSSLCGSPKDKETEIIGKVDAQGPMLIDDSSWKQTDDKFFNEKFVDGDSSSGPVVHNAKLSISAPGGSVEHKINGGLKRNADICQPCQSGASSPDIYSDSEEHREAAAAAANPRPPAKKLKVEKSATVKTANKVMIILDRKRKEALRSVNKFAHAGRRRLLAAAIVGSPSKGGSMSKNRRRGVGF